LTGGYLFFDLLAFAAALMERLEPTFCLPLSASTAAIRVSALTLSAASRALCVALRWLARRFISFALFVPRIGFSLEALTFVDSVTMLMDCAASFVDRRSIIQERPAAQEPDANLKVELGKYDQMPTYHLLSTCIYPATSAKLRRVRYSDP
jgi:hypothetical protein